LFAPLCWCERFRFPSRESSFRIKIILWSFLLGTFGGYKFLRSSLLEFAFRFQVVPGFVLRLFLSGNKFVFRWPFEFSFRLEVVSLLERFRSLSWFEILRLPLFEFACEKVSVD